MKKKLSFYAVIACLVVIDALQLSSPNLLGKIGLFIYKYSYLRTFPKTLLTVSLAVGVAILLAELIALLVKKQVVSRWLGGMLLVVFILLSAAALYKTMHDFSAWSYAHTGRRFRYGAYLLPLILILVFGYRLFVLPRKKNPELPVDTPVV